MFLWLAMQGCLLTNMERLMRGITTYATCQICNCYEEIVLHVLRDCVEAKIIWLRFIKLQQWEIFFNLPL